MFTEIFIKVLDNVGRKVENVGKLVWNTGKKVDEWWENDIKRQKEGFRCKNNFCVL